MTSWLRRCRLALLLPLLAACSERELIAPNLIDDTQQTLMNCVVVVASLQMECKPIEAVTPEGIQVDRIMGGQDTYMKLASSGTGYDTGTEIFSTDVTVQNLMQAVIGTTDGTSPEGVRVFFHSGPTVTSGSGEISVFNADGTATFTGVDQPYYLYNEILDPYEISTAHTWMFDVDQTVLTFSFQVYVAVTMVDESVPALDAVWTGATSTDWGTAGNWQNNAVPDAGSVVAVPLTGNSPLLAADASVEYLRVSTSQTLDLAGFAMTVLGNVDAPGTISGGRLVSSGAAARLGGGLPALEVTGSAALQTPVRTSGPVSVTGTLTVTDRKLTIAIP